jgi:hypothetical protein
VGERRPDRIGRGGGGRRVELYQNGTLIEEIAVETTGDVLRLRTTVERTLLRDAWFVAIVTGDVDQAPLFTPVEIPYIPLDLVVGEALGGSVSTFLSPAVPIPFEYPIYPFAVTNPIWVDVDGGGFDAPGLPTWLERPVEPAEAE